MLVEDSLVLGYIQVDFRHVVKRIAILILSFWRDKCLIIFLWHILST